MTCHMFRSLRRPFFTRRPILTTYTSYGVFPRKDVRMCLFGGPVVANHLVGDRIPPKTPNWGAWIGISLLKPACYQIYWIDSNQILSPTLKTTKCSSWVVQIRPRQIQDGGRPPFWKKTLNRHISAAVWPIFMKFGKLAPYMGQTVKISNFWKSKMDMVPAASLKITKIAISHQRINRSSRNLAQWCRMRLLTAQTVKKFVF